MTDERSRKSSDESAKGAQEDSCGHKTRVAAGLHLKALSQIEVTVTAIQFDPARMLYLATLKPTNSDPVLAEVADDVSRRLIELTIVSGTLNVSLDDSMTPPRVVGAKINFSTP